MNYVEVILPFALDGTFTYGIPQHLLGKVTLGHRVLVQFGKKRIYTGIVAELQAEKKGDFKVKPLLAILDEQAIIPEKLLYFWHWMHKYYMCPIGDVMRAALPSAFKLSSESVFSLTDKFEVDKFKLSNTEFQICEMLLEKKVLALSELESKTGIKNLWQPLQNLLKRDLIKTGESVQEKYKPKIEKRIKLDETYDEESLSELLNHLEKRAHKQAELLNLILHKSEKDFAQQDLLKEADATLSSLRSLEKKGVIEIFEKKIDRLALFEGTSFEPESHPFSEAQQLAFEQINTAWKNHQVCLLHGITGSGKTHIYIELIAEMLKADKQVLYLLPEIALTTQIIKKLQSVFGNKVGVYHSGFNDAERVEIWQKVQNSEYKVILAARSGLFLPFTELGLVIVDEEHDSSYKQFDPAPRYQARDAAIYLAGIHQAKVLLGTATPSLESYENALNGKFAYIELKVRFGEGQLPEIKVLDLKRLYKRKEMTSYFSNYLLEQIEQRLERKEQVILFQNKRGYAPYVRFKESNEVPMCPNCDVSLTYHRLNADLRCHYCGFKATVEQICKRYDANDMQVVNFGTEQVEDEMRKRFPTARVERLDLDNTRRKNAHAEIIRKFEQGETDILVGTQMVTKGLDFDAVALVAVLQADHLLKLPDFRSAERAFQLMEQVSGRAGRRNKDGRVIIQTTMPDHFVIQTLISRGTKAFYKTELQQRKVFYYPPYYRLIKIGLKHKKSPVLWQAANALDQILRPRLKGHLLGPAPPMVGRIKNQYLADFLLKAPKDPATMA
ncbi:MAG: primosomal protein N', partial [Chitinophagales bacterium]